MLSCGIMAAGREAGVAEDVARRELVPACLAESRIPRASTTAKVVRKAGLSPADRSFDRAAIMWIIGGLTGLGVAVSGRRAIERQLNKVGPANRCTRAVAVGNSREFAQAERDEQEIAEACSRLIRNSIVCWNRLYLASHICGLLKVVKTKPGNHVKHPKAVREIRCDIGRDLEEHLEGRSLPAANGEAFRLRALDVYLMLCGKRKIPTKPASSDLLQILKCNSPGFRLLRPPFPSAPFRGAPGIQAS